MSYTPAWSVRARCILASLAMPGARIVRPEDDAMRAGQWLLGVVGVGAVAALTSAGCGTSSSGSSADAGVADSSDDGSDAACNPQPVMLPDAGDCSTCQTMMCGSSLMACNADCTCGGSVDQIAGCLANLPPMSADAGGPAALLGGAGFQVATCVASSGLGGGGGLLGGGSLLGGGGGGASSALGSYLTCLVTSCAQSCFGLGGDGGTDGSAPPESGAPEAGAPDAPADTSGPETGSADAPSADAPVESSVESGTDAPSESSTDAPTE
jgi:hypothetical protein